MNFKVLRCCDCDCDYFSWLDSQAVCQSVVFHFPRNVVSFQGRRTGAANKWINCWVYPLIVVRLFVHNNLPNVFREMWLISRLWILQCMSSYLNFHLKRTLNNAHCLCTIISRMESSCGCGFFLFEKGTRTTTRSEEHMPEAKNMYNMFIDSVKIE